MDRLKAYNEEFESWNDLVNISQNFMDDLNHEVSQGSGEIPVILFNKEKKYLLPPPDNGILTSYISRQEDKTYPVNRESMIKYEGKKYSVPTRYIGKRMTITTDDTACDILRSDAMQGRTDAEILSFVQNNLLNMDRCIGGL